MEVCGKNFGQFLSNKPFELLTKEEKSLLPFHVLAKKEAEYQRRLIAKLPVYYPGLSGCRKLAEEYEYLNDISEGTYGMVYRAQNKKTDEIVALKLLKLEGERHGFPITSLREINMLLKCGKHENIVNVQEIVVDDSNPNNWAVCLVMEFVEQDLKSLMEKMRAEGKKWTIAQIKTLMRQLLAGIGHLHEEFVIHRDLKTANLLLSKEGILKIGDFGMAREFGDPLKPYTPVVCTLWYRAPEILLGTKLYSTPADIWSAGCIFAEFVHMAPIFPGKSEIEQMQRIFHCLGIPNEGNWPGSVELPGMKQAKFGEIAEDDSGNLERKFEEELEGDEDGMELLISLLKLDPTQRISAENALKSEWFQNEPIPADPASLPMLSKDEKAKEKRKKRQKGSRHIQHSSAADGFSLKFDVPKF